MLINKKIQVMKKSLSLIVILLSVFYSVGHSQIREIPKIVEETFTSQYKGATNIDYKDQLVRVDVHFELEGEEMIATYSNKGLWRGTEKAWTFEKLPEEVKDGFQKSKYADREVEDTKVLYLPGGAEQYRILAKKNGVEKKYLYFNTKGRLLRTSLTL